MPTRLFLVRHGQSQWNVEGRIQGRADPPLLAENRIHLLKFFLHLSKQEQAERLQSRLDDPHKNWKFESADLEMRRKWPQFQRAYEDALNCCSTPWSPLSL